MSIHLAFANCDKRIKMTGKIYFVFIAPAVVDNIATLIYFMV